MKKWYNICDKVPNKNCYVLAILVDDHNNKYSRVLSYNHNEKYFKDSTLNELSAIYGITFEPVCMYKKLANLNNDVVKWTPISTRLVKKFDRLIQKEIH